MARFRRTLQTMNSEEAEERRQELREDQTRREAARRGLRRREEIRRNVVAAMQGAIFVGLVIAVVIFVCWLAVSGVLPGFQVRWR